jgi:hypothetical protein
MTGSARKGRRALVPTCDALEPRELMRAGGFFFPRFLPPALLFRLSLATQFSQRFLPPVSPPVAVAPAFPGPIITQLPSTPDSSVSTVPANGDVNPYGVAFVPTSFPTGGLANPGDILVSNFNDTTNTQATGTTIVAISPTGQQSVFFQGQAPLGLTTALGVLRSGFVIVGNAPAATDANNNPTVGAGSLLVLDKNGNQVLNLTDSVLLQGPWDMAVHDMGTTAQLFVSNVLSGTVTRINLSIPTGGTPQVQSLTQIASGYTHRLDPAALVVGPTGLAYDATRNILYVASTGDNAIYAVYGAGSSRGDNGKGRLVYTDPAHLNGPLGLALAPNGDLLTTNGDAFTTTPPPTVVPSALIEFSTAGRFVGQLSLADQIGGAFGLALNIVNNRLVVATVNDITNALDQRSIPFTQPFVAFNNFFHYFTPV